MEYCDVSTAHTGRMKRSELTDTISRAGKEQLIAIIATTLALACRLALDSSLGDHLPYVTFFVAIAFTTFYAGLAAALTAGLLSAVAAVWFFIPPRYSLVIDDPFQFVGLLVFGVASLTIIAFGHITNRARKRTQDLAQGLREIEERLSLAQQVSQIGLFDWNLQTGVNTWSPELYTIYGITPEEFDHTQRAWERYLHPDDRQEMIQAIERSRTSGKAEDREFRIVRRNGEIRWLVGRWRWVKDEQGRPVRLTGVNFDITERKRIDEHVRESEARTRAIFESALDALITMDADGRIEDFNPAAELMFGYSASEAIGRTVAELIIPPRLRERHREGLRRYLETGQAAMLGRRIQMPVLRADGMEIFVEFSIAVAERRGHTPLFIAYIRDISGRQQSERATAHLAAIVKSSDDAIISKDLSGIVMSWNQAAERLFGYRAEEMIGQPVIKLIPPDRQDEERDILEKVSRGEMLKTYETVRRRKDGTDFHVSLTISPLFDGQGRVIGASKIARDVTEQRRDQDLLKDRERALTAANDELNQQKAGLAEVNRELQGFSYSVSHDLRAPLRTIDAYVRIVEEDHGSDLNGEVLRCLGIVRKAAGQAGELIDDLLEFSRLGRIGMDLRPTEMTELAREVADELALTKDQRTIDLAIRELPPCHGDWRLLKLVWMNLLSNAMKFTRSRVLAQIEVGWLPDDRQPDASVYYVKDNGVGFDMKYVHKLFTVFQRLHLKDEFEGTGVGLAIVHRIVQRHGGRVWAEGKIDGGATFFFSLRKAMR
jgi:PAS domain S-box-containing protein